MYEKNVIIKNETGLHARPASEFVRLAGKYRSDITIQRLSNAKAVNAKSIILLLTLGLAHGEEALIAAQGPDEQEAVEALANLIENELSE